MNRLSLLIGIAAFALAGALAVGVAILAALVIENRSVDAVRTALLEDGQAWALVSADGLQVFVAGTAPDEAAAFRAVTRAGAVIDADRVINRVEVEVADSGTAPRFSLDMLRNGDGVQLIGLIPASTGTDAVDAAIAAFASNAEITDMVETADYPAPETWAPALEYGLRALRELPRSKVTVLADRVEVEAISESPEQRARFIEALALGQPLGVEVVLDISAPRPVLTPFAFRAVRSATGALRVETCAADTERAQGVIANAARRAGATSTIACQIGLGAPTPRWGDAVATGLDALSRLEQGGTLTFSDADVTLVAGDGTGQDGFDRVLGELNAALPDVFSLRGVLPPPRNAADTGPARFFATLDPETGVALRGRVPEGTMGDTVHAYAAAAFGSERTDIATLAVPDLPGGWSIRAMAGLMALSHLHEGALTLEPETLRLSGRSGDPEIVGEVTRLLAEELGASADFQIDVVYDESLDPVASLPDPETCVARIQAVQEDRKIVFEPGSVEITEEAGEILDAIAELLPACTHVRMEIGGHTDSHGREEMNLNLSQSRADAVLNGLLARGVLVSNLTAQGYGESQPIASNETEEGRERNRRIEFRLLASAEAAAAEAAIDADAYPYETVPAPRPDSVVAAAEAAGDGDDDDEAEE